MRNIAICDIGATVLLHLLRQMCLAMGQVRTVRYHAIAHGFNFNAGNDVRTQKFYGWVLEGAVSKKVAGRPLRESGHFVKSLFIASMMNVIF